MRPRDIAAYLFLAVTWGFSFLVVLKVVHAFGWIGAVSLRALVAAGVLFLLARLTGRRLDFSLGWQHFAFVGATTVAVQLIGLSYATPRIGTAMAAILVAPIPLFSMLIGQFWGLEKITPQGIAGLILGLIGILLLVGFPAVPATPTFWIGCAASLAGSFAAALGSNYASRYLRNAGSFEVTSGSFLFGGLMTLPLFFFVPIPSLPGPLDFLFLLVLGAVMSALTYVTYFGLLARIGATKTISVEFCVTAVAVLVGALALREALTTIQIAGAIIIILGCALVLGLFAKRYKPMPPV